MPQKRQSGSFRFSSGIELAGELVRDSLKTHVRVHSLEHFRLDNSPDGWVQGMLTDLKQVTLAACQMPSEPGHTSGPSGQQYHARIYPHFILTGNYSINPNEANIESIRFFVDDHLVLSTDHGVYGSLWNLADTTAIDSSKIDPQKGLLLYFSGKNEIVTAKTSLGTVSIEHAPRFHFTHGLGGVLKSRVATNISFKEPVTTLDALVRSETVARFLSLIIGRRQRITKTFVATTETNTFLSVYRRVPIFDTADGERPGSFDLLIDPSRDTAQFSGVIERWVCDEPIMAPSRANLFRSLSLFNKSVSDRLISAANMFDLLPDTRVPMQNAIPSELAAAKALTHSQFKALEPSPERDSILGALGRLGRPSLKRKIRHQIERIRIAVPNLFTDLEIVTDEAVNCRNFYVHGSSPSFNYENNPSAVRFMAEALEFVFVSADLLEAGWDMSKWIMKGHSSSNQMSSFAINYPLHWRHFEKLIK